MSHNKHRLKKQVSSRCQSLINSHAPGASEEYQTQQHSRTAYVFGVLGQVVPFWPDAVNRGFNTRVEQLNNHDKDDGACQQDHLNPMTAQPARQTSKK